MSAPRGITATQIVALTGKTIDGSLNTLLNVPIALGNATGNLAVARLNGGASASATTFWRGDGFWVAPGDVTGPGTVTNDQVVMFSGTTGKLIKTTALSGIPILASGVLSIATAGTHYLTPTSSLDASKLASGTVPIDRLGSSGAPSSTTILYGDNVWRTAPAGGSGGGSVATDTLWAAKGDLAVATADNTATVLPAGSSNNGKFLSVDTAVTTTNLKWATPTISLITDPIAPTKAVLVDVSTVPLNTTRTLTVAGSANSVTVVPANNLTGTKVMTGIGSDGVIQYNQPSVGTPNPITTTQNNYPSGTAYHQRWSSDGVAARIIHGWIPQTPPADLGETHIITNVGTMNLTLTHENTAATSTNRFHNVGNADIVLTPDAMALAWYDTLVAGVPRWRVRLL